MPKGTHSAPYDQLAWFFNRYWGSSFPDRAQPVFQEALLPHLPVHGRILDLCCGTGQLAHWLTGCGFRVTGLDLSQPMLQYARGNAPRADFFVADARSFRTAPVYDAVVSTFDSLNHILDPAGLVQAFANAHAALVADGLLFFDMNMDEGFQYSADETYAVVQRDHVGVAISDYDREAKLGTTNITLFCLTLGEWKRCDLEIVECCYSEAAIRSALAEAGFPDIVTFDADRDFGMPHGVGRKFFLAAKSVTGASSRLGRSHREPRQTSSEGTPDASAE